jgi:hypothetical protein
LKKEFCHRGHRDLRVSEKERRDVLPVGEIIIRLSGSELEKNFATEVSESKKQRAL